MRHRPPTQGEVLALFRGFGGIDLAARLQLAKSGEDSVAIFEAAKAEAKIHYRRLALEHHPDRGGDAEKLKAINVAWERLEKINLVPRQQPQRKSALNIAEARGAGHTSVFVGMAYDPFFGSDVTGGATTAGSSVTRGFQTVRVTWNPFGGTGGF